jgi:hypothetical protein
LKNLKKYKKLLVNRHFRPINRHFGPVNHQFFCRETGFNAKIEFKFRHISLIYCYILYVKMLYVICEDSLLLDAIFLPNLNASLVPRQC